MVLLHVSCLHSASNAALRHFVPLAYTRHEMARSLLRSELQERFWVLLCHEQQNTRCFVFLLRFTPHRALQAALVPR